MDFLNFSDKCVRYSTFLNDVAAKVVHMIKQDANDPEFISQNKAFQMFGRGNGFSVAIDDSWDEGLDVNF